jgi:DNA-binding transcriptional ArsR family regulator
MTAGMPAEVPAEMPVEVPVEVPVEMPAQADEELWSAIADPSRRQVLNLLVSHGAVSASWLAGRVPFSRQAVSKHLVVLERAGLISRRKQGREVLYQVEPGRLDQAARAMAELAAQWDQRLGAIKRLAEAAHAENKRRNPRDQ